MGQIEILTITDFYNYRDGGGSSYRCHCCHWRICASVPLIATGHKVRQSICILDHHHILIQGHRMKDIVTSLLVMTLNTGSILVYVLRRHSLELITDRPSEQLAYVV